MAAQIFISYRTDDALTEAGRLHQSLENKFGKDTVFYDKDGLKPGQLWPEALKNKLEQAKVVILLYKTNKNWLGVDDEGGRRIDDPEDWVRLEIEAALKKAGLHLTTSGTSEKHSEDDGKEAGPVAFNESLIPVLIGEGNSLPKRLPDSLKALKNIRTSPSA